jgi:hypothetical protein
LAAIVSTTIVTISGAYGFSRPVSCGPAGLAGVFESGTEPWRCYEWAGETKQLSGPIVEVSEALPEGARAARNLLGKRGGKLHRRPTGEVKVERMAAENAGYHTPSAIGS